MKETTITQKGEQITLREALDRGYTHFVEDEAEKLTKFSQLHPEDIQYYKGTVCWIVEMDKPNHFSIDAEDISEVIKDHIIEGQEQFWDENEGLHDIVDSFDFSKVADELNEKFKAVKFYEPSDIQVIF